MNIVVLLRSRRASPSGKLHAQVLGPHERHALRLAARLRSSFPGAIVTALTAGDATEDAALAAALTQGADRCRRLWDPLLTDVDALGVARALAAAVEHLGFDLVLTGARSADGSLGFLGPALAEALDIPHLTEAVDLRWTEAQDAVIAERCSATRRYQHHVSPPCLITIHPLEEDAADVADDSQAAARAKADPPPVEVLSLQDVGLEATLLRPRSRLTGEVKPHAPTAYVTAWAEDAAAVIEHLRDLDLL